MTRLSVEEMTVDPTTDKRIRLTDNGPKTGDLMTPQETTPLEITANGYPEGFEDWEVFNGDC